MGKRISSWLMPLAIAFALPASADNLAATQASPLAWRCVQESDAQFHVLCIPQGAGVARFQGDDSENSPDGAPSHRMSAEMRPVAQRGDAEVFSTEAWRVPLHSRPTDSTFVTMLLESVLCGKRAQCSVDYGADGQRMARR